MGKTASEQRGRKFFVDAPMQIDGDVLLSTDGTCALCHSGPMLNTTNEFGTDLGIPPGERIFTAFVAEFNVIGNPMREFLFTEPDGSVSSFVTPDPGLALTIGANTGISLFKIPTLWGVKNTAPYFHDNSALTLEDVAAHYQLFFGNIPPTIQLTDENLGDLVAYMKIL